MHEPTRGVLFYPPHLSQICCAGFIHLLRMIFQELEHRHIEATSIELKYLAR